MPLSITLTFRWPMGHRVLGLPGPGAKCANVHGHNWQADVELPNDDGGLEFGAVKHVIGEWIDRNLDHGFLVGRDDPFVDYLSNEKLKHYVIDGQPTTEAVAQLLGLRVNAILGVSPVRVHVLQGYRNAATWTPPW